MKNQIEIIRIAKTNYHNSGFALKNNTTFHALQSKADAYNLANDLKFIKVTTASNYDYYMSKNSTKIIV